MLVLLASCQSRPTQPLAPLPPLVATVYSAHYAGTALAITPPPSTLPSIAWQSYLIAQVRWIQLAHIPDAKSVPLGSKAQLLVGDQGASPLQAWPRLTAGVQLVEESQARSLVDHFAAAPSSKVQVISTQLLALPPGITAACAANIQPNARQQGQRLEMRIARGLSASGPDDAQLQYLLTIAPPGTAMPPITGPQPHQGESALFDRPDAAGKDAFVLMMRLPSDDPAGPAVAVSVEVRPATPSPADATAIARCTQDLRTSSQELAAAPALLPQGLSQSSGIAAALSDLAVPDHQRASLAYLANECGADLCLDLVLVADNATLAKLSRRTRSVVYGPSDAAAPPSAQALGWLLDRTAFEILRGAATSPEGAKLTPDMATVLTQFAGEAARHPAALDEIAHGLGGEADLHNRVVAQNLLFLTDSSPAARVRAFDWLNSRHLAPPGFDPLARARDRRIALDRAAATSQP